MGSPRAGPYPGLLLHLQHDSLVLLGYGQCRRVDLLIDHFSFPRLKSEQAFSRVTHSVRTETGKEVGLHVFKCSSVLPGKGALAPSCPTPLGRSNCSGCVLDRTNRPANQRAIKWHMGTSLRGKSHVRLDFQRRSVHSNIKGTEERGLGDCNACPTILENKNE